jgi:hypothetical protein
MTRLKTIEEFFTVMKMDEKSNESTCILEVAFFSKLNRPQTVEKIVRRCECFVDKLYNIDKEGKKREYECYSSSGFSENFA